MLRAFGVDDCLRLSDTLLAMRKAAKRWATTIGILATGASGAAGGLAACASDDDENPIGANDADGGDAAASTDPVTGPAPDGGSLDSAPPPTTKSACEAYVRAACARRVECGLPAPPSSCEALVAYCPDFLFGSGSTRTIEGTIACANERRVQSCDEIQRGIQPACATPGTRQGGEPCHFGGQCLSHACSSTFGASPFSCGTCWTLRAADAGCPDRGETCGPNRECTDPTVGCVPIPVPARLPAGSPCSLDAGAEAGVAACPGIAPCTAATPQATTGACNEPPSTGPCLFRVGRSTASVCAVAATCFRVDPDSASGECVPPGDKDALCGAGYGRRPCAEGFFCTDVDKGTCQPLHKANESCTTTSQCERTLYCERSSGGVGICVSRPALGGACGVTSNDAGMQWSIACPTDSTCTRVATGDGAFDSVCQRSGAIGAACGTPTEGCFGALACENGSCVLAACPTPDAGPG